MKVGLYIVSALLFIIATAVAVYMLNPGSYSFDAFGLHMPKLPIAVWIAIPVALLAIFSVLHMLYYGTKVYFANKKWKSDAKRVEDAIYWSLIKEPTGVNFAHDELKKSVSLLSKSVLNVKDVDSLNITDKLKDALSIIKKIENGEYVDLKKAKFAKHLSENNELEIKNEFNHIESDPSYALKIIDFKDKYSKDLVEVALDKVVEYQDFFTLKKYAKDLGKNRFFKLLNRVTKDEKLGFSLDMLKSFISNYKLNCKDYFKLAEVSVDMFDPDSNLATFKEFATKDENALSGYLFLLFKYEMIDKAKDILDEHSEDEYKAYRALYTLKKSKHNFKLPDIINADNACK
jgi:hypothetical protein